MKELSLHVLDIIQNSITAGATWIGIHVCEDSKRDWLQIEVLDNGKGMSEEILKRVTSPFTTTRTTRKVGLGIPLFKASAEACGGGLSIDSEVGKGTKLCATYQLSHIDRPPMGDIGKTVLMNVVGNTNIDFEYVYQVDDKRFVFDTREIRQTLGDEVALDTPDVVGWMDGYLQEGINALHGGA